MPLAQYKKKRNLKQTPEPAGGKASRRGLLAFCVHKHAASHLHYDLRLELDGVLLSWAVPKGPSLDPAVKRLAMKVEDHPWDYRLFEGIIPPGNYGAGTVMLWDQGDYEVPGTRGRVESESAMRAGLDKGHIRMNFHGEKLKGEFSLVRTRGQAGKEAWLLFKHDDADARPGEDPWSEGDQSVVSRRTMAEIAGNQEARVWKSSRKAATHHSSPITHHDDPMPHRVLPMLSTPVDKVDDVDGWFYEPKLDGYRAIAEVSVRGATLYSRNLKDFSGRFPTLAEALRSFGKTHQAVLDGEIVALDEEGRPHFQWLQDQEQSPQGTLAYYVFDLLYLDGQDLQSLPLRRRKELLSGLRLKDPLRLCTHVEREGQALFKDALRMGLEGVMAKDGSSPYRQGQRGWEWLKIKGIRMQEAVVGGFTEPRGGRKGLGALILGVYEGDELIYAGHTGSGFDSKTLYQLRGRLDKLERPACPFSKEPAVNAPAHWVKPQLVAQVKFQEWTAEGLMRIPIFQGIREDMEAKDVHREEVMAAAKVPKEKGKYFGPGFGRAGGTTEAVLRVGDRDLKVTHRNKVFFPDEGITKGDLLDYYQRMARHILPYLKDRPESLRRNPDGINNENSFFHKNMEEPTYPWLKTIPVKSDDGRVTHYLLCQDEATLLHMVNLGCIELNPWLSRTAHLDNPDFCLLDLDPLEIGFDQVVETALQFKKLLKETGIPAFCKTSGSKGLHIAIPLAARYTYAQSRDFALVLASRIHERLPEITSLERMPEKRRKKVYLDCFQNSKGQTMAAPYCVRPKPGAPVSTPLHWEEVKKGLDFRKWNMKTIEKRIKKEGDLWKGVLGAGVDMRKVLGKL